MEREEELVSEFSRRINSRLVQFIPSDRTVQFAELHKKTVIEYAPESPQAEVYRSLAPMVSSNEHFTIPKPLDIDELESLAFDHI